MDMESLARKLFHYCEEYDLEVSLSQCEQCVRHLLLVVDENTRLNLTRITDLDDALVLHLLDSLLFLSYVRDAPAGPVLDMGTGAGFPGVSLAISSHRSLTLLDSVGKKIDAVTRMVNQLHLSNVDAVHCRVEDFALTHRSSYSCVVARAVASLPVLVEYATPLLAHNGLLVLSKGIPDATEVASGDVVARICGLSPSERYDFELPHQLGHRSFFIYRKVGQSRIKLPRKVGMAKHHPLA